MAMFETKESDSWDHGRRIGTTADWSVSQEEGWLPRKAFTYSS